VVSEGAERRRRPRLWARLRYRADLVWDRGTWPVLLAVGSLTLLVVIVSTVILVATNSAFTTEHERTVAERFWQSLLRVIDPGTMATDTSWGPRLLSLMVTISGIVLFGTLIGTISTTMQARLERLRRGRTIVLESGHLVILGWSPWIAVLIGDLGRAAGARRRGAIVVLADRDRAEMEEALRAGAGDRRGPRVICRNGDPTVASELQRVSIREARTVVAIGSDAATSDATVAAMVLAVGIACDGFDRHTVVAEIDDPAAAQTLREACSAQVEVVGDEVIADALAMWMATPATAELLGELLSSRRVRLALCDLPESVGQSFATVVGSIEQARPIGIKGADGTVVLAPPPQTVVGAGELLVCVSDGSSARWNGAVSGARPVGLPQRRTIPPPARLMVIGWNRIAPGVLLELDRLVPDGSTVTVLCDSDLVTAEEIALPSLGHLSVQVTRVPEPELEVVSALADRPCSAIAVLAHQGAAARDADAITLAILMAVRRAATANRGEGPLVVAELTDKKHVDPAMFAGAHKTVARSGLLGDAIALAAMTPEARPVLSALQGPKASSVQVIPAIELGLVGERPFAEVAGVAYKHGLLAIGTRSGRGRTAKLRVHVRGSEVVNLAEEHEVAVIAEG
jgi:ion channel POLLUX/CASTOR